MPSLLIDFEWWRDRKGYRLLPKVSPEPIEPLMHPMFNKLVPPTLAQIALSQKPERIVRRGGSLESYRPLDRYETLYSFYAKNAQSADGLLAFIKKFGPLTESGLKDLENGDEIPFLLGHARRMRDLLDLHSRQPRELVRRIGSEGMALPGIAATLVPSRRGDGLRLRLTPPSLLFALWLQLGQALTGDATVHRCLQCGTWFEAGPKAGRRRDAKFCSDDHRIAFNSRKRSKGG